jgi:hypothetical protein
MLYGNWQRQYEHVIEDYKQNPEKFGVFTRF